MEGIYTKLALYGSKNLCARTDNVFFPISEVCDGTVSLTEIGEYSSVKEDFIYAVTHLVCNYD